MVILISGCPTREDQMREYRNYCYEYGEHGTPEFVQCMQKQDLSAKKESFKVSS